MNLEEIKNRLNYLYFIDIDTITKKIQKNTSFEDYINKPYNILNIENLFNTILKEIFDNISTFISFPPISTSNNFFGEDFSIDDNSISHKLSFLSLMNHCITHTLFMLLLDNEKNTPFDESNLKITRVNDAFLRTGYFNKNDMEILSSNNNEQDKATKDDASTQYSEEKIHMKDHFSRNILFELSSLNKKYHTNNETIAKTPCFYSNSFAKNVCYLLYRSPKLYTLSKSVTDNSRTLYPNYIDTYHYIQDEIKTPNYSPFYSSLCLTENADKYICNSLFEYFYKFQTSFSIINLLYYQTKATTDVFNKLQYLNGVGFTNEINNIVKCPLLYSRSFFFYYACYAIGSSKHLYSQYLFSMPQTIMYEIQEMYKSSRHTLPTIGIKLLHDFFSNLNYIVIPLIEDLWTYIIFYLLGDDTSQILESIRIYINKHYNIMRADFSQLFNTDNSNSLYIPSLYNDKFADNTNFYNTLNACLNPSIELKDTKNIVSTKRINSILHSYLNYNPSKNHPSSMLYKNVITTKSKKTLLTNHRRTLLSLYNEELNYEND